MAPRCPACRDAELAPFFEARGVPVFCNVLHGDAAAARAATRGDLRLGFCGACAMIVNTAFDPALAVYPPEYETSLHASTVFGAYAQQLAAQLVDRYALRGKDVLEIGCGRGEFLASLCAAGGNRGVGFDAAQTEGAIAAHGPDIVLVPQSFTAAHAERGADLIVCRHVLEHAADPRAFAALLRRAAAHRRGAGVFVEVPNALFTLRDLGIWDLIYEHVSYFTAPALRHLLGAVGLPPRAVYTAFGAQFLCAEAGGAGAGARGAVEAGAGGAAVEPIQALVQSFAARYDAKLTSWNQHLARALGAGRRIALWGAGSKGVTFLNAVRDGARISAVVDQSARKQGRHVPGTAQRVVAPEILAKDRPDLVLVANPLYAAEIGARCSQLGLHPELAVL